MIEVAVFNLINYTKNEYKSFVVDDLNEINFCLKNWKDSQDRLKNKLSKYVYHAAQVFMLYMIEKYE